MKIYAATFCLFLLAALIWPLKAYMMSSANYRIDLDSVNMGGTDNSTSTTYRMSDTVGEIATGPSESATYKLRAGYRQMDEVFISVSMPDSVAMAPAIMAITGGTANGSGDITVKTDSPSGYQLSLKASAAPAMAYGGANFGDYSPENPPVPDYAWSLDGANSEFGFTAQGSDAVQAFRSADLQCDQALGTADGSHCWKGFSGTTGIAAALSENPNHPAGAVTTINYRAQVKSNGSQTPGDYTATVTATATAN
jgi:hypothetical protein